jgi:glycosyltransferase involved in cell wall biosynthesis
MRVLHVIPGLEGSAGGVTAAVKGLAIAQQQAGLDVTILATWTAPAPDPATIARLESAGVKLRLVGPASGRLVGHPDLARVTAESVTNADVVHIAAVWEQVQHEAAAAARAHRVPYVVSPHGMLDPWSLSARSKWMKRAYLLWRLRADLNGAAAIHYTCDVERDLVRPLALKPPAIVEPNGIDLSEFENLPTPDAFRARHPQVGRRPIVLFLSRIDPKKGLDLLVPAFARIPGDAVLVIAGPDRVGYRAAVEQLIAKHGVTDRVLFTGMLQGRERVEALAAATIFALPSYQENFGIAVVESLAAGVPVIISDQVNIHADITRAGVGAAVPTQVEPFAAELSRWLSDESLRSTAAARCRPFVCERYDWNRIARHWVDHYRRLGCGSV